jgi:hypothetical protein
MCNFCHIEGNNPNSIQHLDIDCFDKRNHNSRNFDISSLTYLQKCKLMKCHNVPINIPERKIIINNSVIINNNSVINNAVIINNTQPNAIITHQPVLIARSGYINSQGIIIPIARKSHHF